MGARVRPREPSCLALLHAETRRHDVPSREGGRPERAGCARSLCRPWEGGCSNGDVPNPGMDAGAGFRGARARDGAASGRGSSCALARKGKASRIVARGSSVCSDGRCTGPRPVPSPRLGLRGEGRRLAYPRLQERRPRPPVEPPRPRPHQAVRRDRAGDHQAVRPHSGARRRGGHLRRAAPVPVRVAARAGPRRRCHAAAAHGVRRPLNQRPRPDGPDRRGASLAAADQRGAAAAVIVGLGSYYRTVLARAWRDTIAFSRNQIIVSLIGTLMVAGGLYWWNADPGATSGAVATVLAACLIVVATMMWNIIAAPWRVPPGGT